MPHTNSKEWLKRNKLPNRKPSSTKKTNSGSGFKTARRPQAVEYDEKDRYEYLTGFSARKKAGKLAAQERAAQRAREEKLEFRRQLKDARMSKIKEAIEQQTEWYGIDAFEGQDPVSNSQPKPTRTVEKFVEQSKDGTGSGSHTTTTTVTIEPLEVDHTVLMVNPSHHQPQSNYQPHPDRNFHNMQSSSSSATRKSRDAPDYKNPVQSTHQSRNTTVNNKKTKSSSSSSKNNKKKKIPYESKATRSIERVKKQAKRDSKSSQKKSSRRK
ncbi:hypothetical protein PGT21_016064 [Puccinia graminis f. sp. tritici]|uniref:Uncharacterized protein n=1 Tax=Puccinia graminis f. sp. tritici TaxID=56615 RepID=A0A5B0Q3P9_PUCGR|nr:hypothetical protein PGT21_016064 [Puccinia graminis f. sp. tritici]KAA1107703.1 hypothetical protein PGTUg99_001298 [Puccinia graminis f. sp. tritici]